MFTNQFAHHFPPYHIEAAQTSVCVVSIFLRKFKENKNKSCRIFATALNLPIFRIRSFGCPQDDKAGLYIIRSFGCHIRHPEVYRRI
jgi:hypothetical protein